MVVWMVVIFLASIGLLAIYLNNILRQDMANRHQSYQNEIGGLQQKLGVSPGGQKKMIRARDPQGVLHEAPAGTPLPQGWKSE